MYLKSIEINGFKSFANKIIFEFPEGITGIVGPNGSGKSNVADAVRWVLGEQKIKQLRGSKMEDVIFAGTSARKPQSYAFTAITFDNSDHKLKLDFDEVTVSRRVYRSGESEYMINGSVCRLRDVQELFYDTGIGKEGYSIIGQGQIDRILQGKPEERREIFDEAAGIVKYKKRKTAAVRKLENERQNLSRVNDILSELKRQVGPLKKQSDAAQQFVIYKNELTKLDINLFLLENGDIKAKIRDYKQKEEIAKQDLERSRLEYEKIRADHEKLEETITALEDKISAVQDQISRGNIIRESLNGQINVLSEQIKAALDTKENSSNRAQSLSIQINESAQKTEDLLQQRKENQQQLASVIKNSNDLDSRVLDLQGENEEKRKYIESLKEQLIVLVNEKGELNARAQRFNGTLEQLEQRKQELEERMRRYDADIKERKQQVLKLQEEYDNAKKETDDTADKVEQLTGLLKKEQENIRSTELALSSYRERLIKQQTALENLRNLTERYEGYGNTIREVMKLKKTDPGIHGVVADIIRTEKKYETAIETALGGSIQNIVTEDEDTAKSVIEYLKKNKLGRATFLPLKAITGRGDFKHVQALSEPGILGIASDLVHVEEKYKGISSYLLGGILVADTVDNALKIARKYKYSLIIVTLEGELLNRGGSLSGGAFRNKSNLLGRRREMEELISSVKELEGAISDSEKQLSEAKEKQKAFSADFESTSTDLNEKKLYLNTLEVSLRSLEDQGSQIEGMAEHVDRETRDIEQQVKDILNENLTVSGQMSDNEKKTEELKKIINSSEQSLLSSRDLEADEQQKAQSLKVEISKLNSREQYLAEQTAREKEFEQRLKNELDSLVKNNDLIDGQIEEKRKETESIKKSLEEADISIKKDQEHLSQLEIRKEESSASHKDFMRIREEHSKHEADLDKELFRLTSTREKLEERFENKSNYIWEEYQLTYNNALELRDASLDDARYMRDRISSLKASIRSLGTINVSAIEEFKEVNERYEFLQKQHDDLTKAEADIIKIIRDLDREMRKQFNTEFKKIRSEYQKVFKELFGGGSADIILEEDVDILEAGISIIAQPPGKKLQNMMQLSGGEKALTAIALLFAIQNLKPSPFCILDEIEAALDDSNIVRFAEYLTKLSSDVQFIVITHRKGTMEAADRLYGITMQERGVSSLISVDLADIEDEKAS